jgi:regulator of sirC expression with transglutaminase-like and TPR domain
VAVRPARLIKVADSHNISLLIAGVCMTLMDVKEGARVAQGASRRAFLGEALLWGGAALFPPLALPCLEAAEHPQRGQSLLGLKLGAPTAYHQAVILSGKDGAGLRSLAEVIEQYRQERGRVAEVDVLLRIAQDVGESGTAQALSLEEAERSKLKLWRLAEDLLQSLREGYLAQRGAGRAFTLDDQVDCFNYLFFESGRFEYSSVWIRSFKNPTIAQVLERRQGACEDLTGVAVSVFDILRSAGLAIRVDPIIIPAHIFLRFADEHQEIYVELTARGQKRSRAECEHAFGLEALRGAGYMQPQPSGAVAGELNNCGVALCVHGDRAARQRGLRYLEFAVRLCPNVPMLHQNLARAYEAEARYAGGGHSKQAERAIRAAMLLDPDSRRVVAEHPGLEAFYVRFRVAE